MKTVLYLLKEDVWKVTDFTTLLQSRSTEESKGYNPPEFIGNGDDHIKLSHDIWQMGCILFEFALLRRAFQTYRDTEDYANGHAEFPDIDLKDYFGQDCKRDITRYIKLMLRIDESRRPSAVQMVDEFCEKVEEHQRISISPTDEEVVCDRFQYAMNNRSAIAPLPTSAHRSRGNPASHSHRETLRNISRGPVGAPITANSLQLVHRPTSSPQPRSTAILNGYQGRRMGPPVPSGISSSSAPSSRVVHDSVTDRYLSSTFPPC